MGKHKIKVAFADLWAPFEKIRWMYFFQQLEKNYEIEISDDPDYVFCSCFGLFNEEVFRYKRAVRIFFSQENIWPDLDLYDYTITCYPTQLGDRNLTYPYCFDHDNNQLCLALAQNKHLSAREDFSKKNGFCSFVVSNNSGNPIREEIFDRLSCYKKVDSGGRFRNNIGSPEGVADKLAFTSERKFSITFENSKIPGYVTEKILEGFAAHTIPIYWGCPEVFNYFNPKAFIYIESREDIEDAIEKVKYLDENDDAYLEMLSQPALVSADIADKLHSKLEEFYRHIIEQPLEKAYRRPMFGNAVYKELKIMKSAIVAAPVYKFRRSVKKILINLKLRH